MECPSDLHLATGNLRVIQILFGHTKIEKHSPVSWVDIEDALELAVLSVQSSPLTKEFRKVGGSESDLS